jgi:hypothetical protein
LQTDGVRIIPNLESYCADLELDAYARKIHYTCDLFFALSWAAVTGFQSPFPWFYPVFFTCMIIHRAIRDIQKCRRKYGKAWEEYERQVPYLFVPVSSELLHCLGCVTDILIVRLLNSGIRLFVTAGSLSVLILINLSTIVQASESRAQCPLQMSNTASIH